MNIRESICQFDNDLFPSDLFSADPDGTLWNTVAGGQGVAGGYNSRLFLLNSLQYNQRQRWICRYTFMTNILAQTAINAYTSLLLGNSFQYSCESSRDQKIVDEFLDVNDYRNKQAEIVEREAVDGECFLEIFPQFDESGYFRFVDPDMVRSLEADPERDPYGVGIISDPDDLEKILYYQLNKDFRGIGSQRQVPVDLMQHRKGSTWVTQKRGLSMLLSVLKIITGASSLNQTLVEAGDEKGRIGGIGTHTASKNDVNTMLADIKNQTTNSIPANYTQQLNQRYGYNGNLMHLPRNSWIDVPKGMEVELPTLSFDAEPYMGIYRQQLRSIASRFGLPASLLDNTDVDTYASAYMSGSFMIKQLEKKQARIGVDDRELISKCTGIDKKLINVVPGEILMPDRKEEAEILQLLLDKDCVSKQTACKTFEIDFSLEKEIILKEKQWEKANGLEEEPEDPNNNKETE